jgi:hypothetical protein
MTLGPCRCDEASKNFDIVKKFSKKFLQMLVSDEI